MESLTFKAERDNQIMKLLKVGEIRHTICNTDKGEFSLSLTKDGTGNDYRFILDAVPVEPKLNKQLLDIFNGVLFTL